MYVIYKYENVIRNNVNICNIHPMVDPLPLPQFRMSDAGSGDPVGRVPTPGGSGNKGLLMSRRPSAGISPGRLPTMRSRDLTLGGVKKVWHASVSLTHSLHLTTTTEKKSANGYFKWIHLLSHLLHLLFFFLLFRKRLHPTLLAEKLKKSKFPKR